MKKLFILIVLLTTTIGYSQAKHYVCLAPNVSFNSTIEDPNNLVGITLEVGKYVGTTSVGVTTGLYTLNTNSVYSELIVTVPVSNEYPLSVSAGMGWFYIQKEITMEYDINYAFKLADGMSLVVTYNAQSAFGSTSQAYCVGLSKDF